MELETRMMIDAEDRQTDWRAGGKSKQTIWPNLSAASSPRPPHCPSISHSNSFTLARHLGYRSNQVCRFNRQLEPIDVLDLMQSPVGSPHWRWSPNVSAHGALNRAHLILNTSTRSRSRRLQSTQLRREAGDLSEVCEGRRVTLSLHSSALASRIVLREPALFSRSNSFDTRHVKDRLEEAV